MPAAVVAVAGMVAGSYVAAAAVTAGWVVAGGIGAAVISGATSMVVSSVLGGVIGSNDPQQQPQQQQQLASTPVAQAARGVLLNTASTVDPIPVVYGTRRIGGTRILTEASGGSNTYLHVVIAHAEGEIDAFSSVYFDNVLSTDARFSGLFTLEHHIGTDSQSASPALIDAVPTIWTTAHKLSGVAYTYARLTFNQDAWHGLPTITVDMRGRKVYDPRSGLTEWSDNPAICLRDYLTNTRYGRGIDAADIDDTTIIAAANYCDASITTPAGTQKRYTCNGLIDTSRASTENVRAILTCMRGMLVFSGGKYKLVLDKADTAAFNFNEDNITGAWNIKLADKRSRYNRVRGSWINPDNEWQPDLALAESTAYRTLDNGLMLESKIELPFTTNAYEAQMLGQRHLKQSRFGTICSFKATIAGLGCEVGDVVSITHSTPGWTAKAFRVVRIGMLSSDEVEVTVVEYDDSVYVADPLSTPRVSVSTGLPDPFSIPTPGVPAVVEELYETTGSAGLKARATVTWAAAVDAFVVGYIPEYKLSADAAWSVFPQTSGTWLVVDDIQPGIYDFRVRAINTLGVRSAYVTVTKEILGLTAPPATVTNFSVTKVGGVALAAWDLSPDLDVRLGGRIQIRYSTITSGATWLDGIVLEEFNGDAVSGLLPLITGTYMAKAKDSTGNYSTAIASASVTEGTVTGWTTVGNTTQDPTFSGTKTNTLTTSSILELLSATMIDSVLSNIDDWLLIDDLGNDNISPTGSYDFDTYLDLSTVATRRLEADITAQAYDTGAVVDLRTELIDAWNDIDGSAVNDTDATLYYAATDDNPAGSPTWGAWTPFFVADVTCRALKFRLDLVSGTPTHNIQISTLRVDAKVPA